MTYATYAHVDGLTPSRSTRGFARVSGRDRECLLIILHVSFDMSGSDAFAGAGLAQHGKTRLSRRDPRKVFLIPILCSHWYVERAYVGHLGN